MKIEIDTDGLSIDDYSGTITVKSSIGDDTININLEIIGDLSESASLKLTELTTLRDRLDKLSRKDGYEALVADYSDIQTALESAQTEYADGNYETANTRYQSALSDISRLESGIDSLEAQKANYGGIIWIVAIIIILAIIGVVAYKYKDKLMKFINKLLKREQEQPQQEYYPEQQGDYRTEYY